MFGHHTLLENINTEMCVTAFWQNERLWVSQMVEDLMIHLCVQQIPGVKLRPVKIAHQVRYRKNVFSKYTQYKPSLKL